MADLLVCDEKTTRTDSFLRFRFCQRRHSSVICGDVLVIGFVDLLWRWTPAFWFVDGAPMWRRLLEDVGYGSRTPPIDLYSYSIRCGFLWGLFFIVQCPPSGLCLPWRLDSGMGRIESLY